nr:hypothetical protein [Suid alphaherpesvirus 1]
MAPAEVPPQQPERRPEHLLEPPGVVASAEETVARLRMRAVEINLRDISPRPQWRSPFPPLFYAPRRERRWVLETTVAENPWLLFREGPYRPRARPGVFRPRLNPRAVLPEDLNRARLKPKPKRRRLLQRAHRQRQQQQLQQPSPPPESAPEMMWSRPPEAQ